MRPLATLAVTLLLGAAAVWADESAPRGPSAPAAPKMDPDLGFLEFLGSVDGLAESNPDYLAQARPPGSGGARRITPPPPTAPNPPPQEKKNE